MERPRHLRLVSNEPPPPKPPRPRRTPELSPDQRARLIIAIQGLRRLYGTYARAAEVMGMSANALYNTLSGRKGSMRLAVRVAHLAGIPVDTILYGTIIDTDRCPTCKQKLPEKKE